MRYELGVVGIKIDSIISNLNVLPMNSYLIASTTYIFLASSKNLARPISVRGCFNSPRIDSSGQVQTCAPNSAARMMWFGLRMEAANISVLKPCTAKM